jgi:autotransporter strand-loop-strand O-heptosyltransferase
MMEPAKHVLSLVADESAVSSSLPQPVAASGAQAPETASPSHAASASPGDAAPPVKRAYPPPVDMPTQTAVDGIRFDFNDGCRVSIAKSDPPMRVRLRDLDTGNILFESTLVEGRVNSSKRYYVRFRIEVLQRDEIIFTHDYSAAGREVLIQFPVGTLGDTMGWFPYAVRFQEKHGCKLTCLMGEKLIPLFRDAYPHIAFVTAEEAKLDTFYATYSMGLFFDDKDGLHQPCDFRQVGLHRTAGYILGVDPTEFRPQVTIADDSRPIAEPYVCIAVQSSTQCKHWNNPMGWHEIIAFLKDAGYRVVCIDDKRVHGQGLLWNHIPHGAEDATGKPLPECLRYLKHADFFIGLSSGLSWLAWAAGTPVVMISGFTHPTTEFDTPYRIINYHACNSCWNDVRHRFDHHDFLWCPRHKDTPRQFECSRLITAEHVMRTIEKIPRFVEQKMGS